MKVLLQDRETKRYVKADGSWVQEKDATDFKTPLDAIDFCETHEYFCAALVICEEEHKHFMPLRTDQ